jgi:hypothetical protein
MKYESKIFSELLLNYSDYGDEYILFTNNNASLGEKTLVYLVNENEIEKAKKEGLKYIIEMFLVKEIIDVWSSWRNNKAPSINNIIEAIKYYVENDTYLPVK